MSLIRTALRNDDEARQLLQSTSRNIIGVVAALYLAWHFIATLTWPKIFSPSLWLSTLLMLLVISTSLRLLPRFYGLAQVVWLGGLLAIILQAYAVYQRPEVLFLLVFLPLMAMVMVGYYGTLLLELLILGAVYWLPQMPLFAPLPYSYQVGVMLGSLFAVFFGWGLSNNLLSAIDAASFHYQEARRLLEETRHYQAELSVMLKDRNQANYQLERLNQMLHFARLRAEEARADRDRFVLAVSHELRSPLNFIIGFSDLMVNSPETYAGLANWPPGLYDDIQEVYQSSTHLLGLINDILDMGQIGARQMMLFREKTRLEHLVTEVQAMTEAAFRQKGLWLKLDLEPGLPEIFMDSTRIRQVLLNLVNNSLRFTEQGGVTIRVQRQAEVLQVCVEDTGPGIAPGDVPKVFDEFRQVGLDAWRRREGSGLGLSISQLFIQLHGGKIWLESVQGRGSRFYFTLPLLETGEGMEMLSPAAVQSSFDAGLAAGIKQQENLALLVSRDPAALNLVRQWLEDYQIVLVEDADKLPAYLVQYLPQAILIDSLGMDAQHARLKDLSYDLPVIHLIFPDVHGRSQVLPPGVAQYLVKPVPRQALVEAVQKLGPGVERLLVVDNDPAMVRFVTQALKSPENEGPPPAAYQIATALDGAQAIAHLKHEAVDAVLLDLDLPDISGWEVLAQIRRGDTLSQPPVIIISAAELPQMFFAGGRVVLDLALKRALSPQELSLLLKCLLSSLQPAYPKLADLAQGADSAPPAPTAASSG